MPAPWAHWDGDTLVLRVRVHPRAGQDAVVGPHDDSIRIRIGAPPVAGAANDRLVRLLARAFGVRPARVRVISGARGREKRVAVERPVTLPSWLAG